MSGLLTTIFKSLANYLRCVMSDTDFGQERTHSIITETINERLREFGGAGSKAAAENRFTSSSFPLAFAFASRLLHRQNASSPLGHFGTCLNEWDSQTANQ